MWSRLRLYTVTKLADLAGVPVRTLHHYDAIGLLKPSSIGGNGYRYYGEDALCRLQQILFYRELEVPLDEIKRILGSPDFDVLSALESHRTALQAQAQRIKRLIRTIDLTTQHLKGKVPMGDRQLFRGFSEEEQEKVAVEAEQQWGGSVRASNARWKQYSAEKKTEDHGRWQCPVPRHDPCRAGRPRQPESPGHREALA